MLIAIDPLFALLFILHCSTNSSIQRAMVKRILNGIIKRLLHPCLGCPVQARDPSPLINEPIWVLRRTCMRAIEISSVGPSSLINEPVWVLRRTCMRAIKPPPEVPPAHSDMGSNTRDQYLLIHSIMLRFKN